MVTVVMVTTEAKGLVEDEHFDYLRNWDHSRTMQPLLLMVSVNIDNN